MRDETVRRVYLGGRIQTVVARERGQHRTQAVAQVED